MFNETRLLAWKKIETYLLRLNIEIVGVDIYIMSSHMGIVR